MEIVDELILHLLALSIIFFLVALLFRHLSWRKGTLSFTDDRIIIKGRKEFYLKFEDIYRLKHLNKNTVQIRTIYHPVKIKFRNLKHMEYICTLLEDKSIGITLHNTA